MYGMQHYPGGQGRIQRSCEHRAAKPTELWYVDTYSVVSRHLYGIYANRERIALFGALNVDRAGQWIDEGQGNYLGDVVIRRTNLVLEGVGNMDSADFGIALRRMTVAYVKQCSRHVHGQMHGVAGAYVGGVHVAAVETR